MVLRLMACSPRRSLVPPSPVDLSPGLKPASGASGPHVFAVRLRRLRQKAPSTATATRPALLTFAQRPSEWDGMVVDIALICISVNQNIRQIRIFLRLGPDRALNNLVSRPRHGVAAAVPKQKYRKRPHAKEESTPFAALLLRCAPGQEKK